MKTKFLCFLGFHEYELKYSWPSADYSGKDMTYFYCKHCMSWDASRQLTGKDGSDYTYLKDYEHLL